MLNFEIEHLGEYDYIAGCDEVGRGCIAGPLVVACVMLPKNYLNKDIKDSKQIAPNKRIQLSNLIKDIAIEYKIKFYDVFDINNSNPKAISKLGMKQCIESFKKTPQITITDYEKIDLDIRQINLVKGDNKALCVAAASILAKVARDKYMMNLHKIHPEYHFDKNKGYPTKEHLQALKLFGILKDYHRIKYKPVLNLIQKKN
ncbi:ribonuclease HII [Mycoplasma sp. 394]